MESKIVALAGRRIDPAGAATQRFPLEAVSRVRKELRRALKRLAPRLLVSSAACGADLLGLEIAAQLGIRSLVILPFSIQEFRRSSVVDRPGNWGPLFDQLVSARKGSRDLVVLRGRADRADDAYAHATREIIRRARQECEAAACVALLIWDGHPSSPQDATADFKRRAAASGFLIQELIIA